MGIFFIIILLMLYSLQSFTCKLYSDNYPGKQSLSSPVFTIVYGFTVAAVSFGYALIGGFQLSPLTALLAALNALAVVLYNTALIKASATGPYSVLMIFMIAGGIIIPTISAFFFGEDLTWVKIICISVILISVYLVSNKGKETYGNKTTFLIACVCLALGNGAYGALISIQQQESVTGIAEKEEMIALSFFFAAVISVVILAAKEKKQFFVAFKQTKKSFIYLISCSVIAALAIQVLAYMIAMSTNGEQFFDINILYTIDNSGVFILSTLLSCICFKEKLKAKNIIGIILMCAATCCISVFGKELVIHF